MKKYQSIIKLLTLTCALMLSLLLGGEASAFSGSGTESAPYVLSSPSDLARMREDLDAYYILGGNIDMTGVTYTPVGNAVDGAFTGTLDGKGYTISNLVMNLENTKYVGLFGYMEGTVKNVKLSNVNITGGRFVGGIAGNAGVGSSITGCHMLSGAISGTSGSLTDYTGGIVGLCEGEISDCTNGAAVDGGEYVGGIAACIDFKDAAILNCWNTGKVTGYYVGGIVGLVQNAASFSACGNSGKLDAGRDAGGVIGYAKSSIFLTDCENSGQIVSENTIGTLGGLVGSTQAVTVVFQDCTNTASIEGVYNSGGIIGYANSATVQMIRCVNSGKVYGYDAAGLGYISNAVADSQIISCLNLGEVSHFNKYVSSGSSSPLIGQYLSSGTVVIEDSKSVIISISLYNHCRIYPGDTASVFQNSSPSSDYLDAIVWTSSDESVATVTQDGVVTAHGYGEATITATTTHLGITQTCTISVAPRLTLDQIELTLAVGQSAQLTPIRDPEIDDTYTWSISSGSSYASVSSSGEVTAKKAGTATITVTASTGHKATCTVKVLSAIVLPEAVELSDELVRLAVGETKTLTATVLPSNTTDQSITWTSSDPSVATVNAAGMLEALSPGTTTITVTTFNGHYDTCEVRVGAVSSAEFVIPASRGSAGEVFETPVKLEKNPGIAAFTLEVAYDSDVMTPVAVTAGSLLHGGTLTSNIDTAAEDGVLHITWYSTSDLTADGTLFTIQWQAAQTSGNYALTLDYSEEDICNAEKVEVAVRSEPGSVCILDCPVGDIYTDALVDMKDIVYFARWFNGQESLNNSQELAADLYYDGLLNVKDLTALAQLLSEAIPTASISMQANAQPSAGIGVCTMQKPFVLTVSDAWVDSNTEVVLTISGADCSGIAAMRMKLVIPAGFEVVSVSSADLLSANGTFAYNSESGIVTWYHSEDLALNGELFTVKLRRTGFESFPSVVTLQYVNSDFFSVLDYQAVPVITNSGTIILTEPGTCGENLTWVLTDDGTLTISGEGEMDDYSENDAPWYKYHSHIVGVVIEHGVTSIGDYAFSRCENLSTVDISDSVTNIGESAFYDCDALETVHYSRAQKEWMAIEIGENNEDLLNAEILFALTLGDADGDNDVDVRDVIFILQAIAAKTLDDLAEKQEISADVNRDGRITARDAIIILEAIAGKTTDQL